MATKSSRTKRFADGGFTSGGDMLQDFHPTGYSEGLTELRSRTPKADMDRARSTKIGAAIQDRIDKHLASRVAKNTATQTASADYKRGGLVGDKRPQKVVRAKDGGALPKGLTRTYGGASEGKGSSTHTVLSSGKKVSSTHDHLLAQGRAMGYR